MSSVFMDGWSMWLGWVAVSLVLLGVSGCACCCKQKSKRGSSTHRKKKGKTSDSSLTPSETDQSMVGLASETLPTSRDQPPTSAPSPSTWPNVSDEVSSWNRATAAATADKPKQSWMGSKPVDSWHNAPPPQPVPPSTDQPALQSPVSPPTFPNTAPPLKLNTIKLSERTSLRMTKQSDNALSTGKSAKGSGKSGETGEKPAKGDTKGTGQTGDVPGSVIGSKRGPAARSLTPPPAVTFLDSTSGTPPQQQLAWSKQQQPGGPQQQPGGLKQPGGPRERSHLMDTAQDSRLTGKWTGQGRQKSSGSLMVLNRSPPPTVRLLVSEWVDQTGQN